MEGERERETCCTRLRSRLQRHEIFHHASNFSVDCGLRKVGETRLRKVLAVAILCQ